MRQHQPRTTFDITRERSGGEGSPVARAVTRLAELVGSARSGRNGSPTHANAPADLSQGDGPVPRFAAPQVDGPAPRFAAPRDDGPVQGFAPEPSDPTELGARLLLVASDRRFRAMALVLLSRRGYSVAVGHPDEEVTELASRVGAEVVVFDATASLTVAARQAARLSGLVPPIGIVAVSGNHQDQLAAMPVISKWNSFDALLDAIEQARGATRKGLVASVAR